MNPFVNLDHSTSPHVKGQIISLGLEAAPTSMEIAPEPLRFPPEDGGRGLAEAAQRDLDAALQLLAERAQYITGASTAIALEEDGEMVCRASAGSLAPELGARLDTHQGLSAESVQTRQLLHCTDAEDDSRVNRESCRAFGIAAVLVLPLLDGQKVVGIFELLSGKAHAFGDRDISALERLGEMVLTAMAHAAGNASARAIHAPMVPRAPTARPAPDAAIEVTPEESTLSSPPELVVPAPASGSDLLRERGDIGNCAVCGFPVSGQRRLCLDCESANPPRAGASAAIIETPAFLTDPRLERSAVGTWLRMNPYVVGALLIALTLAGVLIWLR